MSIYNEGFKGSVRGCYDATPLEVDVHRLTIACTSLLRSYTNLITAKTRPTLGHVLSFVLSLIELLKFIPINKRLLKNYTTVQTTIAYKNTALAPIINSDLMPPRGSVRTEGYITKIFSNFWRLG